MKKNINNTIIIGFLMIVCIAFFTACEEEGPNFRTFDYPELVVDDFSPKSGRPGTLVSITGSNFGEVVGAAHIFFNGVEIAADNITSYSDTEIVVKVPEEATSGLITINVWKHTKVTAESFEFIEGAKYTTVNPSIAQVGETVTITGENFGTDAGAVQLFIGSVAVDVASVSDTEITFVVPDISSGSLVLNIDGQEITGDYFFIGTECYIPLYPTGTNLCPDPEMTDISLWNGWGGKREVVTGSGAYCGASYMKIVGNGIVGNCGYPGANGEGSALDINLTWEANATYRLHVWVKTIGGSIGFLAKGAGPDVNASYDTSGEWQLIDETFTTGANAGAGFISFNTCDSGANATEVHIDNYELYKVDNPIGKLVYEFNNASDPDYWVGLQNATNVIEDGKLKVTFDAAQFAGTSKRRADLKFVEGGVFPASTPTGLWHYGAEYPILAFKITFIGTGAATPGAGNIKLDRFNGAQNNAYLTDYLASNVIYYDCSIEGGFTESQDLASFQLKIADITSTEETGYEIDWIRTFKTVAELEAFLQQ